MPSHIIDSIFFADQYGEPEMRRIFSDETLLQKWLDVEAALARAEASVGLIPGEAAQEITRQARSALFDASVLRQGIDETFHPIVPLIRELADHCSGDAGRWIHWGATTQDIMDTATVLQIKEAYVRLEDLIDEVTARLCGVASRYRDCVMAGRTHGQHALPITFGFKVAVWAAEFARHRERLHDSRKRVLVGQFAGAVGTLASLGDIGIEVQSRMMTDLGLRAPVIAWHSSRDGFAEFLAILGLVAASVGKVANEVATLQKTEVAELEEPFHYGKVGSSTMPHKRNPMMCEAIIAATTVVRQLVPLGLAAMVQEHERDMGSWQVEWASLPEATIMTGGALVLLNRVLAGMSVRTERMRANVHLTKGLITSETVMLRLAKTLGRQHAHDVVYAAAMSAHERGVTLIQALASEPEVREHLSSEELNDASEPERSLGLAQTFVDRTMAWIASNRRELGLAPLKAAKASTAG